MKLSTEGMEEEMEEETEEEMGEETEEETAEGTDKSLAETRSYGSRKHDLYLSTKCLYHLTPAIVSCPLVLLFSSLE